MKMKELKRNTNPYGVVMSETYGLRLTPAQKENVSTAGTPDVWRDLLTLLARARNESSNQLNLPFAADPNLKERALEAVEKFIGGEDIAPIVKAANET